MIYTDNSIMPFGKYQGKKLANIPASYFIKFLDHIKTLDLGLRQYIKENRQALEKEMAEE